MGSAALRLNPADVSVLTAIDHIVLTGADVLEQKRGRVAQVHQHYGVRNARFGNIDTDFGDDRRERILAGLVLRRSAVAGEDRIAGILDISLLGIADLGSVMALQAITVAPKLLLDAVGGAVEGEVGFASAVRRLEHHA